MTIVAISIGGRMRSSTLQRRGFTLVEILIVISIIAILAAVLLPTLLFPRARSYDVATQTCLKEIATNQEAIATNDPFAYDPAFDWTGINSCDGVTVTLDFVTNSTYRYEGIHALGDRTFQVTEGTPVTSVP